MWLYLEKRFSANEFFENFELYFDQEDVKDIIYFILKNSSSIYVSVELPLYFFDIDLYKINEGLYYYYRKEIENIKFLINNKNDHKSIITSLANFFFDRLINKYNLNKFIISVDKDLNNKKSVKTNEPDLIIFYELLQDKPEEDAYYNIYFKNSISIEGSNYFMRATFYRKEDNMPLSIDPFEIPAINLTRVKLADPNVEKIYELMEDILDYAYLLIL